MSLLYHFDLDSTADILKALAKALGYAEDVKNLLSKPRYHTMEELDMINKNKERKRGSRHEAGK